MLIHILILLLVCIAGVYYYWNPRIKQRNKNFNFVFMVFFFVWIVQTFRDESVGIDTITYVNSFRKINGSGTSWEELNWEKGYVLLNKIVWKLFGDNYHALLGCVSLIILIGIGYFIINNSRKTDAFWPVFFFFTLNHYLTSMVSLRQYCALAIGINIFTVIDKGKNYKNYIKAILLLFLATMFHISALVLGILLLIYLIGPITKKKIMILLSISALVFLSFDKILQNIPLIALRFSGYISGNHVLSDGREFQETYIVLLIGKIILVGLVFLLNEKDENNKELYELTFLAIIGIVFSILTTKMAIFFRFTYYFDIYLIIFIPKVLNRLSDVRIRRILYMICFVFASLFYFYVLYRNSSKCVPYVFGV